MKKHKHSTTRTRKPFESAVTPPDQQGRDRFYSAPEATSEDNTSYFYTLFSTIVQLTKSTVQHPVYTFFLILLAQAAKCEAETNVFVIPNSMSSTISPLPNGNGALIGFERSTTTFDVLGVPYTNGLLGTEFQINSNTAGDQIELDISELNPNGFAATWRDSSTSLIEGRHFSLNFAATGPEYTVSNNGLGTQQHPHVEMDLTGTLTYVWDQQNPDTRWNVHSRSFDTNSMPVGSDTVLSAETTDGPRNPSSAMSPGGIINSVWNTNRQITIDTTGATFIGDMTQGGGLAAAFDGNTNQPFFASATRGTAGATTSYVGLHWPTPQTITGVQTFGANDQGYTFPPGARVDGTTTINLRSSDTSPTAEDDGTGLGFIAINRPDANNPDPITVRTGIDTTAPYSYHFLRFQTSGNPCVAEVVFETSVNRIHSSILGSANTTDISDINVRTLQSPVTRAFSDGTFGVAWINRNPMIGDTIFYQHLTSASIPTGPAVQVNTQMAGATVDHLTIETYDNGAFIGWNSGQTFLGNFVDVFGRVRNGNGYLIGTSNGPTNPAARRLDSNTLLTTWNNNSTVQGTTLTTELSVTVPNEPVRYEESRPVNVAGVTIDQASEFISTIFVTLTLSDPAAGALTADVSGTATFSFDPNTGIGTASGSQADLNNVLSTLQFRSNPDFTGNINLQFDVDGGPSLASSTIALNNIPSNTNATSDDSSDNAGLIAGIVIAILAACGIPVCGIISYLFYRGHYLKAPIPSNAIDVAGNYYLPVTDETELKDLQQQLGYEFKTEKDNKGAFGDNGLYKKFDPSHPAAEPEYFFGKFAKKEASKAYHGSIEHHESPLNPRINDIKLDSNKQFKLVYYMETQTWHIIYKKENVIQIEPIPRDCKNLQDTNPTMYALAKKLYKEDPQQDILGRLIENRLDDYEELAALHAGATDQTKYDEIANEIRFLKTFHEFPKHMLVPDAMEVKYDQAIMMMPIAGFGNGATLWTELNKIADEIEVLDSRKQHLELLVKQDGPTYQGVDKIRNQDMLDKTNHRIAYLKEIHQGLTLRVLLALLGNAAEFHQDQSIGGSYHLHLDTHLGNFVIKLKNDDENNADDYFKVIDFNRSEYYDAKEESPTGIRGAIFITSPDALQANVDGKPYNGRACDLFAIGICALELALGLRAHQGAKHFNSHFDLDKHASLLDQYAFIYNQRKAYVRNPLKNEKPSMTIMEAYRKAMKPIFALPEFKNPAEGSLFWAIKILLSENPESRLSASKISSKVREFNQLGVNELPFDRHREINLRVLLSQLKSDTFYQKHDPTCGDLQKLPETIEKPKARSASLVRANPQMMPNHNEIPKDVPLYPSHENPSHANDHLYQNHPSSKDEQSHVDHSGNFSTIVQVAQNSGAVYFDEDPDFAQTLYNNDVLYNNKPQKKDSFSFKTNGQTLMAAPKKNGTQNGIQKNVLYLDRENNRQQPAIGIYK